MHWAVRSVHCALCTVHCALHSAQDVLRRLRKEPYLSGVSVAAAEYEYILGYRHLSIVNSVRFVNAECPNFHCENRQ